ncbi:adhesion regulating molecule 1 [Podila humilis]|nr:adhesion regulating molecule 1 [Podila humilis]
MTDLILFPGDAELVNVPQCTTGRVLMLQFQSSSQKLFYWLQDRHLDRDEAILHMVNNLIRQAGDDDEQDYTTTLDEDVAMDSSEEPAQRSNLRLDHVLTPGAITPLLSNAAMCAALFPHLPESSEKSPEEIQAIVRTPQFVQALSSFSTALESGQLGPLLRQLGLDHSAGDGVEGFLTAIEDQVKRDLNDNNNK